MRARRTPWLTVAAIGLVSLGVSGCSDDPTSNTSTSGSADFPGAEVDTPALRAQKAAAGIDPCPEVTPAAGPGELPDVTLPCLGGGPEVDLADVRGPAVVNLWATYCGPCRAEAPIFEQLHKKLGNQVSVLGVDYQEPHPDKALAFADELGLTYPQISDPGAATKPGLLVRGLPVTVLVDSEGEITYRHDGPLDSEDELASLLSDHLGIDDDWLAAS
jgi:thiol-disulfide isomerase/thioredoxin